MMAKTNVRTLSKPAAVLDRRLISRAKAVPGAAPIKPVVISYLRYSSSAQRGGSSIERQLEKSREWAKKKGVTIDETFRDEAISAFRGTNVTHGTLGSILRRIDKGEIPRGSTLLVESLDRISRQQISRAAEMFLGIVNRGVKIVTIGDDNREYGENPDFGQLLYSLSVLMRANEGAATLSDRSRNNWNKRRRLAIETGELMTRKLHGWLKMDASNTKIIADQAKVKTVKYIFDLALKGLGVGSIVRKLNAERIPTFTSRGELWYARVVYRMLTEGAVCGVKELKRFENGKRVVVARVENYYPKVIERGVFDEVQALVASRRNPAKTYGGRVSRTHPNIFRKLMKDEHGGGYGSFAIKRKDDTFRYFVPNRAFSKKAPGAKCFYLRQDLFEQAFFEVMLNHFFDEFNPAGNDGISNRGEYLSLVAEIQKAEQRLAEIENELTDGQQATGVLVRAAQKLEERRAELQKLAKEAQQKEILSDGDRIDVGLERMRLLLVGAASPEVREEIGGLVRRLVKGITLKLESDREFMTGIAKIQTHDGREIRFYFSYPNQRRYSTVLKLANLTVEIQK